MIFTKIKYNYKIYLWLLFGLIFMTGIISMLPMLYSGALNNMLLRGFEEQHEKDAFSLPSAKGFFFWNGKKSIIQ